MAEQTPSPKISGPGMNYSLRSFFVAVAVLALIFALLQAEGCGTAHMKIHSLAFSPDGKRIAVVKLNWRNANVHLKNYAANIGRTISLIDGESVEPTRAIDSDFRPGNRGPATEFLRQGREALAFNADGDSLLFPEFGGGKIQRFDLNSGKTTTFFDPGMAKAVQDFALSQDRTVLAATIWNGGVSLLGGDNAKQIVNNPRLFVFSPFRPGIALSADNRWIAALDHPELKLYDADARLRPGKIFACSGAFAFGPRADQLAVADERKLSLRNLGTSESRDLTCEGEIRHLHYLSEEKLVVAIEDGVILLDVATTKEVLRLRHHDWVTALATSPDMRTVAIGDLGGNVILWDVKTGKSSSFQIPGRSGHPWTLPAGLLFLIVAFYVRSWKKRRNATTPSVQVNTTIGS